MKYQTVILPKTEDHRLADHWSTNALAARRGAP